MVIVEDEVEKLAEKEYPLLNTPEGINVDWHFRLGQREGLIKGYRAAQQKGYSEEDIFNFLIFYNNYDVKKIGGYMHPTMDDRSKIHNNKIDRRILEEYIQSLNQETIELEIADYEPTGCDFPDHIEVIKTTRVNGQLMAYIKQ